MTVQRMLNAPPKPARLPRALPKGVAMRSCSMAASSIDSTAKAIAMRYHHQADGPVPAGCRRPMAANSTAAPASSMLAYQVGSLLGIGVEIVG